LETLIAQTEGRASSDYTPKSWGAYREALAAARGALAPGTSQDQVDAALAALRTAIDGLVRATPEPGPSGGPTPSAAPTAQGPVPPEPPAPGPSAAAEPTPSEGSLDDVPGEVIDRAATRVKASQATLRLVKGRSVRLAGYGYTVSGQRLKVSWASSVPSVAKVSKAGKVTALRAGKTTVTLRVGSKTARVKVTVVAKAPVKRVVTKVRATVPTAMTPGQVRYVTGKWAPASATAVKVTYKSSKKAVASIDSAGRLTATGRGTARITVKAGSAKKTYTIHVK
jgi:hypothetical protein